jgi:hypothetical protein
VRSPDERRATLAPRCRRRPTHGHSRGEQRVELLQAFVEGDQLVTAFDDQVLTELITAKHLQHQSAQIAQALLADAK